MLTLPPPTFLWEFDRTAYAPGWLAIERDEEEIVQPLVLGALKALGGQYEIIDAGAGTLRGRIRGWMMRRNIHPGEIARILGGGAGAAATGTPDILGCNRYGRLVAIECKKPALIRLNPKTGNLIIVKPAGTPTDAQIGWLKDAQRWGALVGCAWGPSDIARIVSGPMVAEAKANAARLTPGVAADHAEHDP